MTTAQTDNDFALLKPHNAKTLFLNSYFHHINLKCQIIVNMRGGREVRFPWSFLDSSLYDSALDILKVVSQKARKRDLLPLSCPELRLNHVNLRIRAGHGGMHHLQSSRPVPNTEGNSSILVSVNVFLLGHHQEGLQDGAGEESVGGTDPDFIRAALARSPRPEDRA